MGGSVLGYRSNSDTSAKRWRAGLKNGALPAADAATFLWRSGRKNQGRSEAPPIFFGNRKRGCVATRSLSLLLLTCREFLQKWVALFWLVTGNSDTSAKRWRAGLKNEALPAADAATFLWRSGRKKQGRSEAPQVFAVIASDMHLHKCLTFGVHHMRVDIYCYVCNVAASVPARECFNAPVIMKLRLRYVA